MLRALARLAGYGLLAAVLLPAAAVGVVYIQFRSLRPSIVDKMDQYYLNVTVLGRDEYLLSEDEQFEVPYMASTLSVAAVPTRILDRNGALIGEYVPEKGVYVRSEDEVPAFMKKALVATEDRHFYEHSGIYWKGLARAALVNLRSLRGKQGGSTLTQQLAKIMFTTRKKTPGRKLFEFFCARLLESKFTKDQILLMYLNFAYFGHGCWGLESASQFYFGKPARDMELAECAMLAGIIASPNNYSPHNNPELAKARHRTVLKRMAAAGFIPETAVQRYSDEFWAKMETRLNQPEVSFWRMRVNEAPYVVEAVRRDLEKEYSKDRILKGGLRIRTTIDLGMQRAAQEALRAGLREASAAVASSSTAAKAPLEGGLVAVDPKDGAILAAVGGRGFDFRNQLNRAFDIRRPIGSSVKPFVYAAAFESGRFSPDMTFDDHPLTYKQPGGKVWKPQNYGEKYLGKVRLDEALAKSLNSVAIQLLEMLDLGKVIFLLSKATGRDPSEFPRNLSLALGTVDVSPEEMAAAYSIFVNGGHTVTAHLVTAVEDREGKPLAEYGTPAQEVILSSATSALAIKMMRGVLAEGGTAHAAALRTGFTLPAAGKTGTTNDYRDAWFAGVTPDLAAAVWVGHDDMRIALGQGGTGGGFAAPIWMRFVKEAYRSRPSRDFEP